MPKRRKQPYAPLQIRWQHLVPLAVIALALYVVVPQLDQFSKSFVALQNADLRLVAIGFCCILVSVLCAAAAYFKLSFVRIPYPRVALIQYSSMFINRLLPAGLGGMSLFVAFFYRHKHSLGRATAVVAVNNVIGLLSHATVLSLCWVVFGVSLPSITLPALETWLTLALVALALIAMLSVGYSFVRSGAIGKAIRDLGTALRQYSRRPGALAGGYLGTLGNTIMHLLAMTFVISAFGQGFHPEVAIIVMTGGVFAATASPTPGGLLGAEAGITAVLLAYGVDASTALAIALTYRFVSYWLPIMPGVLAFITARRKHYV